jgi:hypothetical protein
MRGVAIFPEQSRYSSSPVVREAIALEHYPRPTRLYTRFTRRLPTG